MSQPSKRYLGDGVYVEMDHEMVKLTTEDGITATNTIFLEEYVMNSLLRFWDEVVKASNEPNKDTTNGIE